MIANYFILRIKHFNFSENLSIDYLSKKNPVKASFTEQPET